MNSHRKSVEESLNCSECEQLYDDKGTLRCKLFYDAIIEDFTDKHCKDSIY